MDDGLGSLALLMGGSAVVASLVTVRLLRCLVEPARPSLKTARQQPREPEESDSDQEVVRFECDTNRKYYVSSSGSKLHLFQDCWGRYSRVTSYKLCVNCANRAAEVPTLRTRVSTVRSRRPKSKRG